MKCGHIHFTVSGQNPVFYSIDGSLFSKEGRRLLLYHLNYCTSKSYTIPEGTAGIAPQAFAELSNYSTVLRGGNPDPDRFFEVKLPRSLISIPAITRSKVFQENSFIMRWKNKITLAFFASPTWYKYISNTKAPQ